MRQYSLRYGPIGSHEVTAWELVDADNLAHVIEQVQKLGCEVIDAVILPEEETET